MDERTFKPLHDHPDIDPHDEDYAVALVDYIEGFKARNGRYPLLKAQITMKFPYRLSDPAIYSSPQYIQPNQVLRVKGIELGRKETYNIILKKEGGDHKGEFVLMPREHLLKNMMMIEAEGQGPFFEDTPPWLEQAPDENKRTSDEDSRPLTIEDAIALRRANAVL